MEIPEINSAQEFQAHIFGVEHRPYYRRPWAFGIGAVRFSKEGELVETRFPHLNVNESFGSAASFADVTHHRFGNAVRILGSWELLQLGKLFQPFLEEPGHSNVEAYKEVRQLVGQRGMSGVVVFVSHLDDSTCCHNPIYCSFVEELTRLTEGELQLELAMV